jgi:ABC-type phosphate/phosphonate transport system substrate-binding protein
MNCKCFKVVSLLLILVINFALAGSNPSNANAEEPKHITMIVMDPLSAPLACDCVKGYANRQYQRLSEYLEETLKTEVRIYWTESLDDALKAKTSGRADLVIGKDSVVRHQAAGLKRSLKPIASLSDLEGKTTQRGLFVVRAKNSAATVIDLEGAEIFFGPEECDEKWKTPREQLGELGIKASDKSSTQPSCSVAAKKLVDVSDESNVAAIISSYATPLLEGCGTIQKGDLRIIGETSEIPFITAFVDEALPEHTRDQLRNALFAVKGPELLKALESTKGFQKYAASGK